jgi:hypothetical protein
MQQTIYTTYKGGGSINAMLLINVSKTEDERQKTNVLLKYSQCKVSFTMFFFFRR